MLEKKVLFHLGKFSKKISFLVIVFLFSCSTVIQGEFHSIGNRSTDFQFTPTQCYSGERLQFHGIILSEKNSPAITVVGIIDPIRGKVVKVINPKLCKNEEDCEEIFITKNQCSVFHFVVEPTNVRINKIRALKGKLELDCDLTQGTKIKGNASFEYCH